MRTRVELGVAVVAGCVAWVAARGLPGGIPILVAGVGGSLLGAALTRDTPPDPDVRLDDATREVA